MSSQPRTLPASPSQQARDAASQLIRNPGATPIVAGNRALQTAVERVKESFGEYEFGAFARTLRGHAISIDALELGIAQRISSEELRVEAGEPSYLELANALIRDPGKSPVVATAFLQAALHGVRENLTPQDRKAFAAAVDEPADAPSRRELVRALADKISTAELAEVAGEPGLAM
jgi:hypothetical protein